MDGEILIAGTVIVVASTIEKSSIKSLLLYGMAVALMALGWMM